MVSSALTDYTKMRPREMGLPWRIEGPQRISDCLFLVSPFIEGFK